MEPPVGVLGLDPVLLLPVPLPERVALAILGPAVDPEPVARGFVLGAGHLRGNVEPRKPPFGQLPILETGGLVIGQAAAICNYIGKVSGTEGKDAAEYAMSQMLLAEGEDLYNMMQKYQPTTFVKSKSEDNAKFWADLVPAEMKKVEALLITTPGDGFTNSGTTIGEIYLFAMLHQMNLIKPGFLKLAGTLGVQKFYESTDALAAVQKVLKGESAIGALGQYFIPVE